MASARTTGRGWGTVVGIRKALSLSDAGGAGGDGLALFMNGTTGCGCGTDADMKSYDMGGVFTLLFRTLWNKSVKRNDVEKSGSVQRTRR